MSINIIQEYKRYRTIKQLKMLRTVKATREVMLMAVAMRPLPIERRVKGSIIEVKATH
ncbi:hypothetical protein [Caldivirga maquilingensis]|uniref:hypothetical protein n=1 Tax=Caldivirga maquilingensis TaxID=76887 RepID=UPI000A73ABA1|nr:hypothetical protein [Caldivirga maquilingensis]